MLQDIPDAFALRPAYRSTQLLVGSLHRLFLFGLVAERPAQVLGLLLLYLRRLVTLAHPPVGLDQLPPHGVPAVFDYTELSLQFIHLRESEHRE